MTSMASGNIDVAPLVWWGFGLCLLFAVCVIIVARVLFGGRGRRQ